MKTFVVNTMGKVATTALTRALKELPGVTAYKTHALGAKQIDSHIRKGEQVTGKAPRWAIESRQFLADHRVRDGEAIIVTPVREIVGRNISGFFQRLHDFDLHPPYDRIDADRAIEVFRRKFNQRRPDNWFAREYGQQLGISIDEIDFDARAGSFVGTINGVTILIFQLEIGDAEISRLFKTHWDLSPTLRHINDSRKRDSSDLNRRFKERFVLDDALADVMMSTQYMQKFYSPAQREHITAFYQKRLSDLLPLPR
jgi:hypothetical protein